MELWIRSQDKMKLVNNCNLYISNEIRYENVIEDLNNKYLKLGTYNSIERALEVLDEIQNFITRTDEISYVQNSLGIEIQGTTEKGIVYNMPKE